MKNLFIVAVFLLFTAQVFGQDTYYSYDDGGSIGWSTTDPDAVAPVDCSCTPSTNDDLFITDEIAVPLGAWNLGQGGSATITVRDGGSISFSGLMEIGNGSGVVVLPGGIFDAASMTVSGGSPGGILNVNDGGTVNVTGDFTNNNNSDGVTIDGNLDVGGDLNNGNNADIIGSGGISVGGTVDNNGTIGGSTDDDVGTLPVTYTYIDVNRVDAGLKIQWQTATELNNDHFEIERSEDGENFYILAHILGNGTTNIVQNYEFTDNSPVSGVEYYRLKQVDFDGAFEYSNIKVGYADRFESQIAMEVYPNPAAEKLTIRSKRPIQFKQLKLINLSGQVVADLTNAGKTTGLELEVTLPTIERGLYYIKYVTFDGEIGSQKLFVK